MVMGKRKRGSDHTAENWEQVYIVKAPDEEHEVPFRYSTMAIRE
jgi:hypothetical protein